MNIFEKSFTFFKVRQALAKTDKKVLATISLQSKLRSRNISYFCCGSAKSRTKSNLIAFSTTLIIMKLKIISIILITAITLCSAFVGFANAEEHNYEGERPISEILGATTTNSRYWFTDKPIMIEGADELLEMGTKCIKVWFSSKKYIDSYVQNTDWPECNSLVDLLKTDSFQYILNAPFVTYAFESTGVFGIQGDLGKGFSAKDLELIEEQHYEAAKYLLTEYRGTNKTFVFQNWEGDNALSFKTVSYENRASRVKAMIDSERAKQNGITRARDEIGLDGVVVAGCTEVNYVPPDENKFPLAIDIVVPHLNMDLYSISSWGTKEPGREPLMQTRLEYILSKAPPSELYGNRNIMIGEFGMYERSCGFPTCTDEGSGLVQLESVRRQLEYAFKVGVANIFYWQLYDNNLQDGVTLADDEKAVESQLKGAWLIRNDGTKTPTYHYFKDLFEEDAMVKASIPNLAAFPPKKFTAEADKIRIVIDDCELIGGQSVVKDNDNMFVPMFSVLEALGADVILKSDGGATVSLRNSSTDIAIEKESLTVYNGIVMISVETPKALGFEVVWDEIRQTLYFNNTDDNGKIWR